MNRRIKLVLAGTVVAAVTAAGGTGIAVAAGSDDGSGTHITGGALEHASAVALEHTGGGRVTGSEVDDEESYYEIEVTRADGTQFDVQLDKAFNVVSAKPDAETPNDAG
ncbi:MAG TPA: hypothetical protein VFF40_12215 [Acidimicrobiia bacterium]|nr:hypothetical protein [Acidimicrobiia bacterium]